MNISVVRLALVVFALALVQSGAGPAPAPLLNAPLDHATAVPLAATLSWSWRDSILVNGDFEQGLTTGWQRGGTDPGAWILISNSDIKPDTNVASAVLQIFGGAGPNRSATLIQQFTLPADTVTATLNWYESLVYVPFRGGQYPSLTVSLRLASQTPMETLHASWPYEGERQRFKWVRRTNDLSAYAGETLQVVVEALLPINSEITSFISWVDGFSLTVERTNLPLFNIYLGTAPSLGPTNLIGQTHAISFDVANLSPNTLYYWQAASVRDGVTNRSAIRSFTTEQLVLPTLDVVARAADTVTVRFDTRPDRFYAIVQTDGLESIVWKDVWPTTQGTGSPLTAVLPVARSPNAFWRLRVNQ